MCLKGNLKKATDEMAGENTARHGDRPKGWGAQRRDELAENPLLLSAWRIFMRTGWRFLVTTDQLGVSGLCCAAWPCWVADKILNAVMARPGLLTLNRFFTIRRPVVISMLPFLLIVDRPKPARHPSTLCLARDLPAHDSGCHSRHRFFRNVHSRNLPLQPPHPGCRF